MARKCLKCGYERTPSDDYAPDYECPKCGAVYAKVEAALGVAQPISADLSDEDKIRAIKERAALERKKYRTEVLNTYQKPSEPKYISQTSNMQTRQMLGLVGSAILFIGVFMPIVSIPLAGNINYFQNGKGDGVIIIILSILSFFFIFKNEFKKLWYTGIGSISVLAFTFINFQLKMSKMKSDMEATLSGNPFRGLADMAMQSVQIQWGWAVLIIGAAFVIASAAIKDDFQK